MNPTPYKGIVELEIKAPVSLYQMLQLNEHLKSIKQIEALHVGGSIDNDIIIRVRLSDAVQLDRMLSDLPEVERVVDKSNSAPNTPQTGENQSARRISLGLSQKFPAV